tara:strand:- start:2204 stop:2347 length:144 start_codon:yes stop_codon:yes gene_type:complete
MIEIINIKRVTDDMQFDLNYSPLIEIGSILLLVVGIFLALKLNKVEA